MAVIEIDSPELLHIRDGRATRYGANQLWYPDVWQRRAGCGPTCCAHLLWYLSRTRPELAPLCPHDGSHRAGFLALMEETWRYVTPTRMGVYSTEILEKGARRFAAERGISLRARVQNIQSAICSRQRWEELFVFLASAISDNLPVAFLNLSNGALKNLDQWHWVTLVSLDPARGSAVMYDDGKRTEIDLARWLETTTLGGGFIALEPESLGSIGEKT